jgi:hypothetical protein
VVFFFALINTVAIPKGVYKTPVLRKPKLLLKKCRICRKMDSKGKRVSFTQRHWEALQDIVIHAEGGRFIRALVVRDNAKNLDKAEIWNTITSYFNQVNMK